MQKQLQLKVMPETVTKLKEANKTANLRREMLDSSQKEMPQGIQISAKR